MILMQKAEAVRHFGSAAKLATALGLKSRQAVYAWPEEVPVQIHGMDNDPIFVGEGDIDFAREIVDQANDGELLLYSGEDHYFADDTLPSYDAEATALMTERILGLLARVG